MTTHRTSQLPLFFTHPIGSLPRPRAVRDLLAARPAMAPQRLNAAMDDMVRFAIRFQEEAGLDVISDGEWRRVQYVEEFLDRIGGFERVNRFEHQGEVKYSRVIVRRMEPRDPVFASDAAFLRANTDRCARFALPSPFLIAIRYWNLDIQPLQRQGTSQTRFKGSPQRTTESTPDGTLNTQRGKSLPGGAAAFNPSSEVVQEVRVQTSTFDASIGHTGGATADLVLKAGTNQYHGNAVAFLRFFVNANTTPASTVFGTTTNLQPARGAARVETGL